MKFSKSTVIYGLFLLVSMAWFLTLYSTTDSIVQVQHAQDFLDEVPLIDRHQYGSEVCFPEPIKYPKVLYFYFGLSFYLLLVIFEIFSNDLVKGAKRLDKNG